MTEPRGGALLQVDHLVYRYGKKAAIPAVDDVTLEVRRGETLGLVGESGCGKTTLARCVVRLQEPTSGSIFFEGRDITRLTARKMRPVRKQLQMVFQDPVASLNPRKRVGEIVAEGLRLRLGRRGNYAEEVAEVLVRVGLRPEFAGRFPHEFSGGQRQRIGIARSVAVQPDLIVLDEPVSALDVSVQAQVMNLLMTLQNSLGLGYLLVAHDLAVVRQACDRIVVMYMGKIVESASCDTLYERPSHPYTKALLAAAPVPERHRRVDRAVRLEGEATSAVALLSGCRFRDRCPRARDVCAAMEPPLIEYPGGRLAACHFPENIAAEDVAAASVSAGSPRSADEHLPSLTVGPDLPD
jgi:peptide/nickel transport system ATP-binding protein